MRDIFLAVALVWCLYNTWDMRHNYKQDRRSDVIDKMTLKILKIHCNRLDKLEELVHKYIEKGESYGNSGKDEEIHKQGEEIDSE